MQVVSRFIDHPLPPMWSLPFIIMTTYFMVGNCYTGHRKGLGMESSSYLTYMRHRNRCCASVAYYQMLQSSNRRLREEYWQCDRF